MRQTESSKRLTRRVARSRWHHGVGPGSGEAKWDLRADKDVTATDGRINLADGCRRRGGCGEQRNQRSQTTCSTHCSPGHLTQGHISGGAHRTGPPRVLHTLGMNSATGCLAPMRLRHSHTIEHVRGSAAVPRNRNLAPRLPPRGHTVAPYLGPRSDGSTATTSRTTSGGFCRNAVRFRWVRVTDEHQPPARSLSPSRRIVLRDSFGDGSVGPC
jgi:hypothetical protein